MSFKGLKMNRILIILSFLFISQACDYKRDSIGGNDDIVVLAAKEDREKISSLLSIVFNDTLLTPSPESVSYTHLTLPTICSV